ncbi:MAG: hypothetical protein DWQ47_14100 [Acidobacteria bacterium]|nr:MAG: hypothetical protein DWQ32_01500 [Acidobacteriota bacterium]REK02798.1 MAG: hypothetical protein DWQ38_10635 [Acidobacteriota bacterium]REK13397.1 MAG: hypothetical protein DWQ43_07190 [Acidobacteriota bacterium]REK41391.1 MAG: hypothetical protein DWQ47_14100 [Acidobacteriota bacterium]
MLINSIPYKFRAVCFGLLTVVLAGCTADTRQDEPDAPVSFREVPAQRLNYRFEADVPPPELKLTPAMIQQRNEAVQKFFDENRPLEILNRTIESPDKTKFAAVYREIADEESEFRLDIFSADGSFVRKVTHEEMAIHFPDTIVWSPDSRNLAFVAMVRAREGMVPAEPDPLQGKGPEELAPQEPQTGNSNSDGGNAETAEEPPGDKPPTDVITFRTEQIYLCNSEGLDLKPLTKNEGLMYFYFVWAPDSSSLVSLATSITEWRVREARMKNAGEVFAPEGRPRLVEKNGRERLLDDFPTTVWPVWSPDSAKVAVAFDRQIRIYDAIGDTPTQAAVPLQNELLLASKSWEEQKKAEEGPESLATPGSDSNSAGTGETADGNTNSNTQAPTSALPDPSTLVSFNPIVAIEWTEESMIYFQTAFVKNYLDSAENVSSFARWHRLILSPQESMMKKEEN